MKDENGPEIGEVIRRIRKEAELTIDNLAAETGLSDEELEGIGW